MPSNKNHAGDQCPSYEERESQAVPSLKMGCISTGQLFIDCLKYAFALGYRVTSPLCWVPVPQRARQRLLWGEGAYHTGLAEPSFPPCPPCHMPTEVWSLHHFPSSALCPVPSSESMPPSLFLEVICSCLCCPALHAEKLALHSCFIRASL